MWELCARLHFLAGPPGLASASAPIQWCFAEERSMGKSAPEEHIQQSSDLRVPSAHLTGGVHGQLVPAGTAHAQKTREVSGVGAPPPRAWPAAPHQLFKLLLNVPACALSILVQGACDFMRAGLSWRPGLPGATAIDWQH